MSNIMDSTGAMVRIELQRPSAEHAAHLEIRTGLCIEIQIIYKYYC